MATPEEEARKKLLAIEAQRRQPTAQPEAAPSAPVESDFDRVMRKIRAAGEADVAAQAKKATRPPAPKVTAPPKAVQPTVVETPKFELPPDIKRVVNYRQFYEITAGSPTFDSAQRVYQRVTGASAAEFNRVAEAQGVSLQSIYEARRKGRTFDEIARANRDRGVIGFMPVAEREAAFRQTVEAAEKAMRGEAADTITLKKSGADTSFSPSSTAGGAAAGALTGAGFGGAPGALIGASIGGAIGAASGYAVGGTSEALPEVSKPGEHGYSLSSLLVDSLKRDDNATKLFDLYGRQVATGATQKYVSARTDELVKRAGITASTPDGPARVAKLRRQALNEVIAYKTVGQWTPAVTLQDVEVTEGDAPPGIFGALKPNIELIGFNNQNQAVFRQESPLGVLFRAIDVPQAAVVGALEGSASRGVQTGANFLEYALDNTEGASPYLRYPAVGAGFVASVIMPDSLLAGGLAFKGTKAVARTARFQVVKKEAVGLLKTVAEARKAGDFPRAIEAEARLRRLLPTVADDLDRYDAEAAKALTLINSDKSDIFDEDMTALIGGGPGELSDLVAREAYARVWQHPSMRKDVLSAKLKARDVPLNVYAELYDTARQKERIVAAKADYVRNAPQNLDEYAQRYARGAAKDAIAGLLARAAGGADIVVPKLSAADVEAIAQIVAQQAPKFMSDKKAFFTDLDAALKADARFGGDDFKLVRQALATDKSRLSAQLGRKLTPLIGKSVQEIQAPDLALFDRALIAVDQNNEARGMAAALLFEEVANRGKIRVEPLKIFDEVLPRDEAGNPLRLSPGASLYLYQVRRLMPTTPLSELIQAVTIQDQVVINAARKQKRDPFDLWRELFGDIRRGTDEDLNRLVGAPAAPPTPPTPPTPAAPPAPSAPAAPAKTPSISASAAKIIGATPSIPANVTIIDVATATDARALLDETLKQAVPFAQIREGDAFGVVMGDVRIVAEPTTPEGPLRVIVKVGTAPARAITAPPKTGRGAALRLGFDEAEKLMTARVARGEPAMKGAPDIRPAPAAAPAPAPAPAAAAAAPKKLSISMLQREGGIGYNKAAALLDRVKSGELTEAQALEEARRMGSKAPAPAAAAAAPAPAAVPTPAPAAAAPSRLPILADTVEERKEQLRAYLRANPGAKVQPLFRQFQLLPADVKAIHKEVKAERAADAERIPELEAELDEAVQSGDEFRQGELEMEIENLRRMTPPKRVPAPAAAAPVVEAPPTPAVVETPPAAVVEAPTPPTPTVAAAPKAAPKAAPRESAATLTPAAAMKRASAAQAEHEKALEALFAMAEQRAAGAPDPREDDLRNLFYNAIARVEGYRFSATYGADFNPFDDLIAAGRTSAQMLDELEAEAAQLRATILATPTPTSAPPAAPTPITAVAEAPTEVAKIIEAPPVEAPAVPAVRVSDANIEKVPEVKKAAKARTVAANKLKIAKGQLDEASAALEGLSTKATEKARQAARSAVTKKTEALRAAEAAEQEAELAYQAARNQAETRLIAEAEKQPTLFEAPKPAAAAPGAEVAPEVKPVVEAMAETEKKFAEAQKKSAADAAARAEAIEKARQEKSVQKLAELEAQRKTRDAEKQKRLEAYQAEQIRLAEEKAKKLAEREVKARVKAEEAAKRLADRQAKEAEKEALRAALEAQRKEEERLFVEAVERAEAEKARKAADAAARKVDEEKRAAEAAARKMAEESARKTARDAELEAERAARAAQQAKREAEAARGATEAQRKAAEAREALREEMPLLADLEDRFPLSRPANLKVVLREISRSTTNESYKRIIDRLLEQGGRFDGATFQVVQAGDVVKSSVANSLSNGADGNMYTAYNDAAAPLLVHVRGTSLGKMGLPLDEIIVHEAIHAATVDQYGIGIRRGAKGTSVAAAAEAISNLQVQVVNELKRRLDAGGELMGFSLDDLARMVNKPTELIAYGLTNPQFQALLKTIKVESEKSAWTKFVEGVARLLGLSPADESALSVLLERTERLMDLTSDELEAARRMVFPNSTPDASVSEIRAATVVETPITTEAAPNLFPSIEPATSRLTMSFKDVTERVPELKEAAGKLQRGEITAADYDAAVNRYKPVLPYEEAPAPTTEEAMRAALKESQQEQIGAPRALPEGTPVGLRLDIPAYKDHGAWVVTVHEPGPKTGVGPVIGYDSVAAVRNARFEVGERAALGIAAGKAKGTIAKVKGEWFPMTPEQAKAAADAALADPAWRQVGMDPERHSYFYDRATTEPIVTADEVIQIGPLVLAKNPKYAPKSDFLYSIERDAQRADINRAAKKRQADVIIARLYGDDLAAEYEEIPSTFRVAAAQRLRKAEEGLAAGKITQEQFNKLVEGVSADLSDQAQIRRTRAAMADRRRGADWVRSRLLAAKSDGVLDEAGVDLADWFIQQNPSIADDLAVSVRKGSEFSSTAGFYEATNRVVTLFKERGGELTATHEVLHHTERMLPDALRTAIREEWSKRLTAAIKTATPEQRPLLTAMLAGSDRERVMKAFEDGKIPLAFYQFANPSEFWAVNASSIVAGRYAASNKGLGTKAKRWLTEFAQKVKSIFGLQSDAPLIRGLDAVLKGDGTFVSKEMLSQGDVFRSIEPQAPMPSGIPAAAEARRAYEEGKAFAAAELERRIAAGEDGVRAAREILDTVPARFAKMSDRELGIRDALAGTSAEAQSRGFAPSRRRSAARRVKVEEHPDFIAAKDVQFKALDDLTAARRRAKEEGYDPFGYTQPKYVDDAEDAYRKANDAAADVSSRLYARAGRSGTVEIAPDAPRALPSAAEPTQIKSAIGNVGTFSPTEPSILKQTDAATGEVKGLAETLDDGRNIIYLFQGADVSTLLHEGAHIIRKRLLDAEDMENITQWIKGRGVNVSHEFGEFIGDADEVEKAEELFAQAFETYIKDGNAPTPRLAAAFEQLKQTMVAIYRNITSPLSGVTVTPAVKAVFDKLLAESPETSFPSLQKLLRRELLGEADADSDFIQRLSQAAQRKGVPRTTLEDLGRQFDTAKKKGTDPADTYISFPTPVLGKKDWSFEALAEAQQRVDEERINLIAKKRGIGMNLLARSSADAALVEEDSPIESLRSALSVRPDETGAPAVARTVLRGIAATMFGGDVVREKGVRLMPPEMRKALDTGDRRIEESIGNTVTLLNDSLETGSPKALEAFLSGEADVKRAGGRPIVSAGHDYMASFQRMIARAFDSLSEAERDALHELAGILQRPDWQEELPRIGFNPDGTTFAKASEQAVRQREAVASAIMKMLYRSGSGKEELGVGLSQAISRAVEATATPRPTHEFKLVELMTYIAGKTNRGSADAQKTFDGGSAEAVRAFLNGAGDLYDEASKRRLAVVIGGYGAADLAKQTLVKLNLGINEAAKTAFTNWIVGESWPAEYTEEIQRIVNRYGLNPDFVEDTILGVDYYIPREARKRMASALARVNYQPAEAAAGVDAFNNLYRYMKTRMTRGTFFLRQRYFLMNTLDHFIQMAMTAGFAPAANSVTRVIVQDLMVLPGWQQAVALLRKGPRAKAISEAPLVGTAFKRDALERMRRVLQSLGDVAGNRIGQFFSAAKYRVEVNPILEGLDGGFRAGGRVYTYREIRNIAVEEGIFASFDTRQLARAVQREGSLYVNQELARWGERSAGSLDQARRGSVVTGRVRNFVSDWEETVADTAEAWGERERLGAMVALMEAGHDPRIAARLTIDALYDYSQSMTKADRSIIVGIMFPFWAFQKNANAQVFNLMFSPWGAYRMMAIRRARERSADLLTAILYGEVSGEYEVDVESMPPDLQDSYYALITEFESAYDGNPPEDAKRAMRFLLTGRGSGVEDGALYQMSPRLLQMRSEGLFSDAAKFAAYAQLRPSDASRVSYLRERAGFAVPFPRTEAVRLYYSLLGDNHAYMEVFLPESSVEAGLRHITQMAATYMVMGSFAADFFSGGALTAGGLREVKTMRVLEPVFDPERSPILGPLLADMSSDAMPPKRLAKELGTVVEGTQSVAMKIHPFIGKLIDDMYGTTLLRTPADIDPFVVYEGNLQQLSPEQQERIRAIQSEYPDAGKLRDQRYYIPGGIWSMAFENTPFLGELNALLIRYEEEPLERTNIRGEILALSRGVLGVDVSMTSPAKAVKFEEPRKLRETKGL